MTICSFCVMDSSDPEFDLTILEYEPKVIRGCNHCLRWRTLAPAIMRPYDEFEEIAEQIIASRPGYNCILGVSGGLDSTYTAYVAHQAGLKALLVHLDNGFDTPEAEHNLAMIREATGWEMTTLYADGPEYRDIQEAYLKAGIANMEAAMDHAISALVYYTARVEDIKYVLSGQNWATEGILPKAWGYDARDLKNIKAIHDAHGTREMDRFQRMPLVERMIWERFHLQIVKPLNYVDYDTQTANDTLIVEWGYKPYGDKHGENTLTRFFQKYILPARWNVDKRRAHLSALICNGEITRPEAMKILQVQPWNYPEFKNDYKKFLDTFNLTAKELRDYIIAPRHTADEYPNNGKILEWLRMIRTALRGG